MWSERYRPSSIRDMVGNEEARGDVVKWLDMWKPHAPPLLLSGPPGTGKTTIARLASKKLGYDLVELNASDDRSKSRINRILGPTLDSAGLTGRPAIFIDEVDGIHGRSDYGGGEALLRLIKKPPIPVIMAANVQTDKMKGLISASKHIRFHPIPPRLLRIRLLHVLKEEKSTLRPGAIIRVISQCQGDIRAMLNLAQTMVSGFRPDSGRPVSDLEAQEGIEAFFAAKSPTEAVSILYSMQIDPREKINAFYSSVVCSRMEPSRMARMLEILSRADMLYGRIISTQNWRLLRYLNAILAEIYESDTRIRYTKYNLPFPVINRIRFDSRKIRSLNAWLGKNQHTSGSVAAATATPYYIGMVRLGAVQPPEEFEDIISKEIKA